MMLRRRAAQGRGRDFGKADATGFAFGFQLPQKPRDLFNRDVRIAAVHIEEIHVIGAQTREALVQLAFQMRERVVVKPFAIASGDGGFGGDVEPIA